MQLFRAVKQHFCTAKRSVSVQSVSVIQSVITTHELNVHNWLQRKTVGQLSVLFMFRVNFIIFVTINVLSEYLVHSSCFTGIKMDLLNAVLLLRLYALTVHCACNDRGEAIYSGLLLNALEQITNNTSKESIYGGRKTLLNTPCICDISHYSFSLSLWYISQNYLFVISLHHLCTSKQHLLIYFKCFCHPCKWLCPILYCFLHYHVLLPC